MPSPPNKNAFVRAVNAVEIVATSPDGSVEVVGRGTGSIEVTVLPGGLDGHTSASLTEQINLAIGGVIRGLSLALAQARREYLGIEGTGKGDT